MRTQATTSANPHGVDSARPRKPAVGWHKALGAAAGALVLLTSLLSPLSAGATVVYFDNFNDGNDDGWTRYNPLGGGSYQFPGGDSYQISSTAPANPNFGPARAGSIVDGVTASDFIVSVDLLDWDPSLPQTFGIVARVSEVGLGTTNGYLFSYSPGASAGRSNTALAVERLTGEQIVPGGSRDFLSGDLPPQGGYRMVFSGSGSQLTGALYALSDLDTALGSATLNDATYASGGFGLLVADSNVFDLQGATATFDNFRVETIPEPPTLILLLSAMTFALAARVRCGADACLRS